MKATQQLSILENGIWIGTQIFTSVKDLKAAVAAMRSQLNQTVSLEQIIRNIWSANIQRSDYTDALMQIQFISEALDSVGGDLINSIAKQALKK
jgi:hypothetical protein